MRIPLSVLQKEIPGRVLSLDQVRQYLPMLGFPIENENKKSEPGDTFLDIETTLNRSDVLSIRGLARDLAAKLGTNIGSIPTATMPEGAVGSIGYTIDVKTPLCSFYAAALMELPEVPESELSKAIPADTKNFLELMGSSSTGLPSVDASNEYLYRYGQPTHAFDLEKVKGPILVRCARDGEEFKALNGQMRKLTEQDLVIADEDGPIALAGVIGSERTKVTSRTRRLLIESALFDPVSVRTTAHRHNLHTEASNRFGRGVDPALVIPIRDLLAHTIAKWAQGQVESAWEVGALPKKTLVISMPLALLERMAGRRISQQEAIAHLEHLGASVVSEEGTLKVTPPSWRHDLTLAEDLVEEILRLEGYEHIESVLPSLEANPLDMPREYMHRQRISEMLAQMGFFQIVTLGFQSKKDELQIFQRQSKGSSDKDANEGSKEVISLSNPLSADYSIMRSSLLPALKKVVLNNINNGQTEVCLFEIAPVYKFDPERPRQTQTLAVAWGGRGWGQDILTSDQTMTPVKLVKKLKLDINKITVRKLHRHNTIVFWCFETELLAPGEDSQTLPEPKTPAVTLIPKYKPFSRYPSVHRDLSILVPKETYEPKAVVDALKEVLPSTCKHIGRVDVYQGPGIPEGQAAWLVRFQFQADRNLTTKEVNDWMNIAIGKLEEMKIPLRQDPNTPR